MQFTLTHGRYRVHWPAPGAPGRPEISHDGDSVMPEDQFCASLVFSLALRVINAEAMLAKIVEEAEQPFNSDHAVSDETYAAAKALIEPGEIVAVLCPRYFGDLLAAARGLIEGIGEPCSRSDQRAVAAAERMILALEGKGAADEKA